MYKNHDKVISSLMKHIYIFYVCTKYKNFTQTGKYLSLSQSAISKSIAKLEENLGFRLFVRHNSHIELSNAGEKFYEQISPACKIFLETVSNIKGQTNKNIISFYSTPSFIDLFNNNFINEFHKENPHISIKHNIYDNIFSTSLLNNDFTICCLKNNNFFEKEFIVRKLFNEDLVAICHPSLISMNHDEEKFIRNSHFIVHSSRENFWPDILAQYNLKTSQIKTNLELEHFYMILRAVLNSQGVGLLPRKFVEDYIINKELVIPFEISFKSPYKYYLCIHNNKLQNNSNQKFLNWFDNNLHNF